METASAVEKPLWVKSFQGLRMKVALAVWEAAKEATKDPTLVSELTCKSRVVSNISCVAQATRR
jgi:hypothetical protein